ncbi:hypothetical protein [Streptomyces sp. NPDC051994]|uniref:hypothetical protein n=1 Tax=unclassified Streptomyces TaxID=2593676 RepID=UPI00341F87A4
MNTTAAALEAHVTIDTIRAWCRIGAVTALKQAGRWIIDTASLAHRIAIGAMRARKQGHMSQAAAPAEVRFDERTTIRAHQATSPAYGTTSWYASEYVNGWKKGIPAEGATAEEAIAGMRRVLENRQARTEKQDAVLASLAARGLYAGFVDVPTTSIHQQLNSLMAAPSSTGTGQCDWCGLNSRTCDCY